MRTKTKQELFWEGKFGADYTERNAIVPEARRGFFERILSRTFGVQSICELGSNRGHNLQALSQISPNFQLTGVEINAEAFALLKKIESVNAVQAAIQEFSASEPFDLVFIAGVLIHISPEDLPAVYAKMASLSKRYVLINEYFNPSPVEIEYRGHEKVLFKRDFAGEFLDATKDSFEVVDYGFLWSRVEPAWDNSSWFLMQRKA